MLVIRLINLVLFGLVIIGMITMFIILIRSQQSQQGKAKSKEGALPSDDGLRNLLLEGRKDDAVDLYRQFTDVDEFTARQAVDEIERELGLSDAQRHDIRIVLENDGKASAIEAYQSETGANLAEALEFVETIEEED